MQLFIVEYDDSCGFVIYGLYYIKECSLSAYFLERFYHQLMFSFIKSFFCVCWNDHMVFILQFVNDIDLQILKSSCILGVNPTWSWFMILTYVSEYLLWINVCLGLLPISLIAFFVFLLLNWRSCLYILDIKPLSVILFANIFSHSIGCFFILFMVSFVVQKLVSLIRSHLFIFSFIFITLGDQPIKHCYGLCQRMFCLCSLLEMLWYIFLYLSL